VRMLLAVGETTVADVVQNEAVDFNVHFPFLHFACANVKFCSYLCGIVCFVVFAFNSERIRFFFK